MHFGIGPQPNTDDQSASLAHLPARSCPEIRALLPRKADIARRLRIIRFMPKAV